MNPEKSGTARPTKMSPACRRLIIVRLVLGIMGVGMTLDCRHWYVTFALCYLVCLLTLICVVETWWSDRLTSGTAREDARPTGNQER